MKILRKKHGYSITKLASLADVSKSYISYIERGIQTKPSPYILSKLARILHISVEELMDDTKGYKKIDQEWMNLLIEAVENGLNKQDFKIYIDYMKYKKETKEPFNKSK